MAGILTTFCQSDRMRVAATVLAISIMGAGVAGAAIAVGPDADANPAMRPLTIGRSIQVTRAFGPDDEDCVYATHRVATKTGKIVTRRELVCAD